MENHILDYWPEFDHEANLVVAGFFDFESEGRLAVARLREEGIRSTLTHSLIASTLPLGSGAIRLQVLENDLPQASRILAEMNHNRGVELGRFFPDADEEDISFLQDLSNSRRNNKIFWWLILLFLLVFLLLRVTHSLDAYMTI